MYVFIFVLIVFLICLAIAGGSLLYFTKHVQNNPTPDTVAAIIVVIVFGILTVIFGVSTCINGYDLCKKLDQEVKQQQ